MPDPNGIPGGNMPQQPYNYQQPQQQQYGYQQPQQPQNNNQQPWNRQQPQQPQYGYQQPQQAQQPYGTQQQPQQPQYNYQQPQQPQQPYGYQQQPYGYRQPQAAPAVTHKKAIGSMIMMILALLFLAYPLGISLVNNLENAFDYGSGSAWLWILGDLGLITGLILMLVGAIIGSRGSALFGVGLLLCLAFQFVDCIYSVIDMWDFYEEGVNVLLLGAGVMLATGTLLAAIGCLARVKALKIVGGILMLVNFPIVWILDFATLIEWYSENIAFIVIYLLRFVGFLFACIAVLALPIRRVKK